MICGDKEAVAFFCISAVNFSVALTRTLLTPMVLSRGGNELQLGVISTVSGLSTLLGSLLVYFLDYFERTNQKRKEAQRMAEEEEKRLLEEQEKETVALKEQE